MKKILISLLLTLLFGLVSYGQDTDIFLKGITNFKQIDIGHDGDGNTYVLGERNSKTIIQKYGSSGDVEIEREMSQITNPVAFDVGSNGYIYVAGSYRVKRLKTSDLSYTSEEYTLGDVGLSDMSYRDVVYVSANDEVVACAQRPGGRWPRLIPMMANLSGSSGSVVRITTAGVGASEYSTARSVTADDLGNVYLVGETSDESGGLANNRGYIAKYKSDDTYTSETISIYEDLFQVSFHNGWVYLLGIKTSPTDNIVVSRFPTSLGSTPESSFVIKNTDYSDMINDADGDKMKFSFSVDALDNIFVTGYIVNGLTQFYSGDGSEFKTIASTSESAFVAKLDSNFDYQWIKTPIQSPLPNLGPRSVLSWDGQNSRLWWSGTFAHASNGLSMQDGSDNSTLLTLSQETSSQGFVAAFEPDGAFTEVVDFTLMTDYAETRVKLNDIPFNSKGETRSLILGSTITIQTPREVYQDVARGDEPVTIESPVGSGNYIPVPKGYVFNETDNIEANPGVIDEADTRYTFENFSVNSVVQESEATVYSLQLSDATTIQLEWIVDYALIITSDFSGTFSLAKNADGTRYVEKLSSNAAGSPEPGIGKTWQRKDSPVVLSIDGAYQDLSAYPGLNIRFVPYAYDATGAALDTIPGTATSLEFTQVEPVQELAQFTMSEPGTVEYKWKLQYGVEVGSSITSAEPQMLVQYIQNGDGSTTGQSTSEGGGVHWYDDQTVLKIGAPESLDFGSGPQTIKGWLNGDNYVFNPSEDDFGTTVADFFTPEQIDDGFQSFNYNGTDYVGLHVQLDRPARVVWRYGDRIIFKNVFVGDYIEFTEDEIADFGLDVTAEPTLAPVDPDDVTGGVDDLPTNADYLWDSVAKKFYPIRPVVMDLQWSTDSGTTAKVKMTSYWGTPDYQHIAAAPPVSLISHPPVGEPDDLIFKNVAYTNANAFVDDSKEFTADEAGRTVLEFNRITPAGRGGSSQSIVELKVVQTKLWNDGLGAVESVVIGQKITSASDLAGLDTGYAFFSSAPYNGFVYDRDLFSGESLWDTATHPGPVIPVNIIPDASPEANNELVIVWYDNPVLNDYFLWPYKAERYQPRWPVDASEGLGRILMSSRYGSESVDASGNDQNVIDDITVGTETVEAQTTFDPGRFEQVQIYNQPDKGSAGYNPNEEHGLMAPSLRNAAVAPRPLAAYAMRENDLNNLYEYTSEPYVLVQFLDKADNEFKMKVYSVEREDLVNYPNGFSVEMVAGEPVIPYYPLDVVSGATLCESSYAREGNAEQLTYWKDHKSTAWAVSGDGLFHQFFYYPLSPDFWWPDSSKSIGDCVAWLPDFPTGRDRVAFDIDYSSPLASPNAQEVLYTTSWPLEVATLKVGETLTYAGGEYASDYPGNPGLPGVLAWAAGEVVYDALNPDMREATIDEDGNSFDRYTARMISALEERTVSLPLSLYPDELRPATGRSEVDGTLYRFPDLSSSLKKRVFYNPLTGELGIEGLVNDKDIGDNTLTAAPPAVYVLEPNILTQVEYDELKGVGEGSPFADLSANSSWTGAVDDLFNLSRNPSLGSLDPDKRLSQSRIVQGGGYTAGLQAQSITIPGADDIINTGAAESYQALGPGLALVANPGFLDPNDTTLPDVSYVTLAENNDPNLGGSPVILHIIKIDRRERYRGAIKVVLSDNVFDENIILRHTGDFGAYADDLVFDWWYRVEDGTEALPPDAIAAGTTNPWKLFPDPSDNQGEGFFQLKLKGNPQAPELLLADSLWFVRYRHKDEAPNDPVTWDASPEIPYEWAGAGNSTPRDIDSDGLPDYQAQLAQGWVKRVLDAVNPYEARIRDFTGENPATYASMIRQLGQRYEGPVALNPDKDVIENVGLIELYATILNRARSLSIDLSTPVSTEGITNALLLASTRLADFYMLLGNEAYTDAKNPAIGFGSDSVEYGALAPTVFTFQNQLSSQMEEELGLLRGVYDYKARPVYNRLFWNFTKGEGEAAYAMAYNLSDVTADGFINEDDAMVLYPQGHGDAWGHYLTAIGGQYDLLNNPYFNWVSRSELYSLQDIVFEVDFLDERKFAQVAAAKAKAGAEIVDLTYRDAYVADPESQWQGYLDTDSTRAWGVEGWARRAGQGAYFDWVTANALIPSEHPNSSYTGIKKVDRTTVKDIAVISANMNAIQQTFKDANNGFNPLGLSGNTVPFDIDPTYLEVGSGTQGVTHFEQIYERAVNALNNAVAVFDNANQFNNMLRGVENSEIEFRRAVFEEDKAYRNELIEIFGTPYAGTIGSGAAYPAGYDGPDTSLYMYVDRQTREISDNTVPGYLASFATDLAGADPFESRINLTAFNSSGFQTTYAPSFSNSNPSDWIDNFSGVNYIVTGTDGITFDTDASRVGLPNMNLPIKASGYTFEAPDSWGDRASPGELQLHIAKMIQQEAQLAVAISAWDGFQGGIVRQLRLLGAQLDTDSNIRGLMGGKIANKTILGAALIVENTAAKILFEMSDSVQDVALSAPEFIPKNLPTGGLAVSPGDAAAPARGAIEIAGQITSGGMSIGAVVLSAITEATELTKDLIDEGLDFEIDEEDRLSAFRQSLVELEDAVGDEGILRVQVFSEQEALRELSEEYRALLQKGARLMDAREAYNKRVAELVQRNRYQDMSFRVARNAALQRYQEAFDLAARYTYLAAKAYDYETNLHPNDAGSAQSVINKIMSQRGLGYVDDGVPQFGKGGLAEQLATLKANFDVLEGQLGLNNPQNETGRFSLRQELFRITPTDEENPNSASDVAWRDALEAAKVDNLWDLPEFNRYCRPFAAFDPDVAEPGIVIDFTSYILSRKNFFGRSLAGGDNAYDPTNFSTKIFSVGTWFEGYLSSGFDSGTAELSETPRIYLIPVGSDVMAYPSDTNLGVRMWDVLDQKIPVPYPVSQSNLDDSAWRPLDTLGGTEGEIRKFSSFRAYHDSGYFNEDEMTFDSRLVGRSVWNTRWLLIIPGSTLNAEPDAGLDTFIQNISDIKLFFQTYGFSGN